MPINISFQPAAAAVGGLGLLGGLGEYAKWRTQQNFNLANLQMQAAQNAQQMQMHMMDMANQNQQRQQQNFFDLAKMPMQAQIEAQQQAFQSGLQGQNQIQLAQLQGQIHSDQSVQDAAEQQRLLDAQQQGQLGNQMEMAKYNDTLKQQQQTEQLFQNPLQQHLQNVKTAQGSGYTFSPEQQQSVDQLKKEIQSIQDSVNDPQGGSTRGVALPALRQAVSKLNAITPSQPPPQPVADMIAKGYSMGLPGPDGTIRPGTEKTPYVWDYERNRPRVMDGFKPDEGGTYVDPTTGEEESLKAHTIRMKNNLLIGQEARKAVEQESKSPFFGINPVTGTPIMATDPDTGETIDYRESRLRYWKKQIAADAGLESNPLQGPQAGAHSAASVGQRTENAPGIQAGQAAAAAGQPTGTPQPVQQNAPGIMGAVKAGLQMVPGLGSGLAPFLPSGGQQQTPQQGQQPQPLPQVDAPATPLPPRYQAVQQQYMQMGNQQAAQAVQTMYDIVARLGPDAKAWPPDVKQKYLLLGLAAPDFNRAA